RWMHSKKGQYADGHERPDVVAYRQGKFLPAWSKIRMRMDAWSRDNLPEFGPDLPGKHIIVWFHDKSILYAHDRRRKTWYHKDAPAETVHSGGEGASLMVADFVSAKYGWLLSPDGKRSAQVVMTPGKNKDGYSSNVEIREQAKVAMDIVTECYPDKEHVLVYDNATTHLKRPEGSVSASKMLKGPFTNFTVEVILCDEHGAQVYTTASALQKHRICMADTEFDGKPQVLYYPEGHLQAGLFKGMLNVKSMLEFANRSARFMDAYIVGSNGPLAAWAAQKYPGHRMIPGSLMDDLEEAGLSFST
ncbi:hypothetical protein C8R43DRAFT_875835, partial [Mycena crocata]